MTSFVNKQIINETFKDLRNKFLAFIDHYISHCEERKGYSIFTKEDFLKILALLLHHVQAKDPLIGGEFKILEIYLDIFHTDNKDDCTEVVLIETEGSKDINPKKLFKSLLMSFKFNK